MGKNNFVNQLDQLGPSFEIKFDIKIRQFRGQVLQLTFGDDREIPILAIKALHQRLEFFIKISHQFVKFPSRRLRKNFWHNVVISFKFTKRGRRMVIFALISINLLLILDC